MVFSVTRFATPPFYFIGRTGAAGRADVASVEAKWRTSMAAMGISMTRSLLYRFRLNRYSDGSRPICQAPMMGRRGGRSRLGRGRRAAAGGSAARWLAPAAGLAGVQPGPGQG